MTKILLPGYFLIRQVKTSQKDNKYYFQLVEDPWQSTLDFVFQVKVDSKDRTWFTTQGKGVYCIEPDGDIIPYKGNDSLELRYTYSICEDQRNVMWILRMTESSSLIISRTRQ